VFECQKWEDRFRGVPQTRSLYVIQSKMTPGAFVAVVPYRGCFLPQDSFPWKSGVLSVTRQAGTQLGEPPNCDAGWRLVPNWEEEVWGPGGIVFPIPDGRMRASLARSSQTLLTKAFFCLLTEIDIEARYRCKILVVALWQGYQVKLVFDTTANR
jgi:hypothetical protein